MKLQEKKCSIAYNLQTMNFKYNYYAYSNNFFFNYRYPICMLNHKFTILYIYIYLKFYITKINLNNFFWKP